MKVVETGYKLDLHIHSVYSRGKDHGKVSYNTLENIATLAEKLNDQKVQLCALTDHDAFNFDIYKVELADNTTDTMGSHGNYVLIYVKGQIRTPDYSGGEDPYEYIDAYFCFVFCDAVITRTGEFTMAVNDIEQRYICNSSFDAVRDDARTFIGAGYEYTDVPLN